MTKGKFIGKDAINAIAAWADSIVSKKIESKLDVLTAGDNIEITNGTISATVQAVDISGKQDVLTAGDNILINGTTISATNTTYSAGDNININNGVISVLLSEATTEEVAKLLS